MTETSNNKRKASRYRVKALKRVTAAVQISDGYSFDGILDDISVAGAGIRFAANAAPSLEAGQVITITLRLPLPSQKYHIVDIQAEVRYLAADDETESIRCGLQFDRVVARGEALYGALRALANRRNEPRITPARNQQIPIILKTADGTEVEGKLRDISANGARVLVGGDFATDTIGLDSIALSFHLPSEDHDTKLAGKIQNRQTKHDETYVGIRFDDQDSPDFGLRQREIIRYLMRRQREMVRK